MSHAIITRQSLRSVISLATDGQANAIIAEGICALEDFAQFQPADIKTLCSSVRKPGGTIEVPTRPTQTRTGVFQTRGITSPPYARQGWF